MKWHILNTISDHTGPTEVMAAGNCDGIGVIARWRKRQDGNWSVYATDTEQAHMSFIHKFDEDECVPENPPLIPAPARTEEEIVEQTEHLADKFAEMDGFLRNSKRRWFDAMSPRGIHYWKMACLAQEILTQTDVENAVASIRPDTHADSKS